MKLEYCIKAIESLIPKELIEEGDPSGLQIASSESRVKHIRVALEATNEVIESAIEDDVDLLVVHHPLLFTPIQKILTEDLIGQKVYHLIRNNIALYAAHSNLDRAPHGLNRYFGQKIGLRNVKTYTNDERGYVLIGELDHSMSLKALTKKLIKDLKLEGLSYVGIDDSPIEKVAFVTGSGMSLLDIAVFEEVQVFITGDLKYHDAMWVHESGLNLIDVTHFGSEYIATDLLYEIVKECIDENVKVSKDESVVNPIKYARCLND